MSSVLSRRTWEPKRSCRSHKITALEFMLHDLREYQKGNIKAGTIEITHHSDIIENVSTITIHPWRSSPIIHGPIKVIRLRVTIS